MKVKSLLVGMMACVALGACTNQDLVEDEIGNGNNASTDKAYIGIRIADPTNGFSRAASDGGFDYGTTEEHDISSAEFFFYKDGAYVTKGVASADITINGNTSTPGTPDGSIEANVPAVVVLHQTEGKGEITYPNQVVAFLNLPAAVSAELEGESLTNALGTVKDISDIEDFATNDKFIMTNSVYATGDNTVQNAVAVTVENFAQTAEAAKNNPVTIYVERVAAKVTMTETQGGANTPNIDINYNGNSEYQLKLEIDGWGINAVNKSSYLVKNITPASWSLAGWSWNDYDNFRSYWAKDDNYSTASYPTDWEAYNGNEENSPLEYRSWADVVANDKATQYCLENTMDAATAGNINATTYMVIAGHYKLVDKEGKESAIDENTKLYKYIDRFYLEADLLNVLANQANLYTLEDGKFTKLKASYYEIVRASLYDGKLVLKATTGNFYTAANNESQVTVAEANERLANLGTFTAFAGGKTFFYTPIKHLNSNVAQDGHIGIVRNHTYQLTLNEIKNLGNGVFDPDEDIIITPKAKEFYVAATLNILSWKVVEQGVDL